MTQSCLPLPFLFDMILKELANGIRQISNWNVKLVLILGIIILRKIKRINEKNYYIYQRMQYIVV